MENPAATATPGEGASAVRQIRRNWHKMSTIFGINHGCVTTPLIFATTLLNEDVGYAGSALLYVFTCLGSLLVSVPTLMAVGQRWGLFIGMSLYTAYVGSFALAAAAPEGSWAQWLVFLPGSCVGGVAASILWTAYGGYMDRSSTALLAAEAAEAAEAGKSEGEGGAGAGEAGGDDAATRRQRATAEHTSTFAVYYLALEVGCKLLSSLALRYEVEPWLVFTVCLILAAASTASVMTVKDFGPAEAGSAGPAAAAEERPAAKVVGKLLKAVALWPDPALWLLSLTNLTFGFAAAFMNGKVNAAFTKPQLGADYVGFFATATALTAAVASHAFGLASKRTGSKGPFVLIGSLCFFSIPALVLLFGLEGWHFWLIVPYLLQGCGRAVYESTSKGVLADFFPGAQSEGAFANAMMQTTLSFAFCFFFQAVLSREVLASIVLVLAALTFPCYLQAKRLRAKQQKAPTKDDEETTSAGSSGTPGAEDGSQEDEEQEERDDLERGTGTAVDGGR